MKRTFMWAAAMLFGACSQTLQVEVANTTEIDRAAETVEIAWTEFASLKGLTPDNVIVVDDRGCQVPSQVIFRGGEQPLSLIFQVDADARTTERFVIRCGRRDDYPTLAYGRYVPERLDDYAWENDKAAFRAYGPALETAPGEMLATPGFDTWVKSTERMVIDERYARGHYHDNQGDGMDCYKVGKTLGAGASAPLAAGELWLSRNYATQRTLDNGPLRTSVELTYAPFDVDGRRVSLTKIISLDAGTHFNRMENIYEGDFEQLPIAAGFIRHDVKEFRTDAAGWIGMREAASDSKQPEIDGDIYLGVILPGAELMDDIQGHAVAVKAVTPGEKLVYYAGSGWSQGGVDDMEAWIGRIEAQYAAVTTPLQVTVRK